MGACQQERWSWRCGPSPQRSKALDIHFWGFLCILLELSTFMHSSTTLWPWESQSKPFLSSHSLQCMIQVLNPHKGLEPYWRSGSCLIQAKIEKAHRVREQTHPVLFVLVRAVQSQSSMTECDAWFNPQKVATKSFIAKWPPCLRWSVQACL